MFFERVFHQHQLNLIASVVRLITRQRLNMKSRSPTFVLKQTASSSGLPISMPGQSRLVQVTAGLPSDILAGLIARQYAHAYFDDWLISNRLREIATDWIQARVLETLGVSDAYGVLVDASSRHPECLGVLLDLEARAGVFDALAAFVEQYASPSVGAIRVYSPPAEIWVEGRIFRTSQGESSARAEQRHAFVAGGVGA